MIQQPTMNEAQGAEVPLTVNAIGLLQRQPNPHTRTPKTLQQNLQNTTTGSGEQCEIKYTGQGH